MFKYTAHENGEIIDIEKDRVWKRAPLFAVEGKNHSEPLFSFQPPPHNEEQKMFVDNILLSGTHCLSNDGEEKENVEY